MSKIFNVVDKANLIDFGELPEPESAAPASASEETPVSGVAAALPLDTPSGRVAELRIVDSSPIFPFDTGNHEAAEQYRIIRTKLIHHPRKPQLLVISSSTPGDGKTVTAINLAASLALRQDSQILLVDGDLRRPRIAEMLGFPATPGLAEVLAGDIDLDAAIVRAAEFSNFFILPAGAAHNGASELLESPSWLAFVAEIRSRFTHVLFDAPPIAVVADYELIQLACDGAIVVVRPDHSNRAACMNVLQILPRDKLIGVVVNGFEPWWLWKRKADVYSYYRDANETRTTAQSRDGGPETYVPES